MIIYFRFLKYLDLLKILLCRSLCYISHIRTLVFTYFATLMLYNFCYFYCLKYIVIPNTTCAKFDSRQSSSVFPYCDCLHFHFHCNHHILLSPLIRFFSHYEHIAKIKKKIIVSNHKVHKREGEIFNLLFFISNVF